MTLPLAQAKTGLLALTRREIRNQCPHGIHHHGAERTGDDPSGAQWPEGLAIRPTPRACRSNRQYLWIEIFYAASSVAVVSSGRSTSLPFSNFAPARTSATRWGALTARQRDWAASISL